MTITESHMNYCMAMLVVLSLTLGIMCQSSVIAGEVGEAPLNMGVFPRKGFIRTIESFTPLAEYMSEKLGRKVVVKSSRNFADFWRGIEYRQYDIVHYNQYHYVKSKKEYGYEVFGKNEENHQSSMSGAIIVRKDSGIDSLADLRGKKIIFGGGVRAMQSYIIPSFLLEQSGLKPSDYEYAFAESPPNAIYTVYFRQANAAGSADINLQLPVVKKRIDISDLKIIARSEKLAHLPWAMKNDLETDMKLKIKSALINLSEIQRGKQILESANLTGILPANDEEYHPHRRIIKQVLGEEY